MEGNTLKNIREISAQFGISTRTLRYYEEIGLIKSIQQDENAMRFYNAETEKKLAAIVALRETDMPMREIEEIMSADNFELLKKKMEQRVFELTVEIDTLVLIKIDAEIFLAKLKQTKADNNKNINDILDLQYETTKRRLIENLREDGRLLSDSSEADAAFQIAELLLKGDYEHIPQFFGYMVKRLLPPEKLRVDWERVTRCLGEASGIYDIKERTKNDYLTYEIVIDYGDIGLSLLLSFKDKVVVGLYFDYKKLRG